MPLKILNLNSDDEEVCEICQGTGVISSWMYEGDSNTWMVDGEQPCECQYGDEDVPEMSEDE